ncbi:hypothetical protein FRC09_020643 [Ceratobasidium sp. 395]|nr:hypothetical protein FRC09_020643 [Ceratobasidium sp. 395]
MESIGGLADLSNLSSCLLKDKDFEVYSKKNQTKDQMISELRKLPISRFCLVYLQGHGIPGLYLPKDTYIENGERQGLTSQAREMHDTLLLGGYRRLLLLSDFCHAGNYYQLQYYLCIDGEPEWKESPYWKDERSNKSSPPPTLYFAGASRNEHAQEGDVTGGFFTKAISETCGKALTLPERLRKIRELVSGMLQRAKDDEHLSPETTQTPQIFCSFKPVSTV